MSDDEAAGKKSGYRVEYAKGGASKCKGPKPCSGTKIGKGELRLGSLVDFRGNTSFAWRHWGCTTAKLINNMKRDAEEAEELDGFDDLNEADQEKLRKAWQDGHVADEDIPDSARKADGDEEAEDDEDDEKPKKAGKKAADKAGKKAAKEPEKSVFKFEYAANGRSKCKDCGETIGKGYFRLGYEVNFRGHKSLAWGHFGCTPTTRVAQLIQSYDKPEAVEGFDTIQDADKEKVRRAWDAGSVPEEDQGLGEPIETEKKKPAPRKKKADDDDDRPKKRARKAPAKDEDEDEDMDEEEEKPKAKRAAKKPAEKKAAPAKKRAAPKKKKAEASDESGEDFGDELANISGEDDEEPEEEEETTKKRKRAPAKASSSKAAEKPTSKAASKPASKKATKPASSRSKRTAKADDYDEEDEE